MNQARIDAVKALPSEVQSLKVTCRKGFHKHIRPFDQTSKCPAPFPGLQIDANRQLISVVVVKGIGISASRRVSLGALNLYYCGAQVCQQFRAETARFIRQIKNENIV